MFLGEFNVVCPAHVSHPGKLVLPFPDNVKKQNFSFATFPSHFQMMKKMLPSADESDGSPSSLGVVRAVAT